MKKGAVKQAPYGSDKEGRDSADQRGIIGYIFGVKGIDHTQQFFSNVGHGNTVGFAFSPLFGVVFGKYGLMGNQRQAAVHKSTSEI